jgi:hypothetical protein
MKRSFTLVEVIVAVFILVLVGTALVKNGADSLEFLQKLRQKERSIDFVTIFANHPHPEYNRLTKSLEDFSGYSSSDDELRKLLKRKFSYRQQMLKVTVPTLEGFDEEQEESSPINIHIVRISFKSDPFGEFFYMLELDE